MKPSGINYKRIVVKIGSSLFCGADNTIDTRRINDLTDQVIGLAVQGSQIIVVSSGAIALGMATLGLHQRPRELFELQAAAAIGQNELMDYYRRHFGTKGYRTAQVLLTWEDFKDRRRYLNAKNTLLTLLKYHSIPVINENDTVSTEEIRFGDNDRLSALVSSLIGADLLIILSDVDGLLDKDNKVVSIISDISPQIKALATPTKRKTSVGGMIAKIDAAKIAVNSGIPCVIANGSKKDIISQVCLNPQAHGTLFLPKKMLAARKRWLAFGTRPQGIIKVDEGAKKALLSNKSLLSVGITAVKGEFAAGDVVCICGPLNEEFARGKANLSSKQLEKAKGSRLDKEVIHCNDIVVL